MRRFISGFLWMLGVGAAVAALRRPSPQGDRESVGDDVPLAGPPHDSAPETRTQQLVARSEPARSYLSELWTEIREDDVTLISGSMAYYGMLSLFPALIAAVSIYGLILDPGQIADQLEELAALLPGAAGELVEDQLNTITSAPRSGLQLSAVIGILVALYTASAGMRALIRGLNIAYDVEEDRSWPRVRALAYGMTGAAVVAGLSALAVLNFLPGLLEAAGLRSDRAFVVIVVIPLAFIIVLIALNLIYRIAPSRHPRYASWASTGAVVAAAGWILASIGLSIYLNNFSNLNATYGTLTGVIVLLLWFFLSGFVVLLGAEINGLTEARRRHHAGSHRSHLGPAHADE